MDTNIQIQALKSQIENIKLQIDNIEMQSNNMLMMNNNSINEQILNLSIQMFNAGIQAFNTGKNMNIMMNMQTFYDKLKKISEQINSIIIEYDNMNQMQLMQQQMMMQQMQQQIMMQQQIEAQQQLMQPHIKEKYNVTFKTTKGKKDNLAVDYDMTVEELLNRYINNYYGPVNGKLVFLYNAKQIKMNEKRTIKDFFICNNHPIITVDNY